MATEDGRALPRAAVSTRTLTIIAVVLWVIFAACLVTVLLVWHTPAMHPLPLNP